MQSHFLILNLLKSLFFINSAQYVCNPIFFMLSIFAIPFFYTQYDCNPFFHAQYLCNPVFQCSISLHSLFLMLNIFAIPFLNAQIPLQVSKFYAQNSSGARTPFFECWRGASDITPSTNTKAHNLTPVAIILLHKFLATGKHYLLSHLV